MQDWNVVVSTREGDFNRASRFLRRLGTVHRTGMYNVLVMKVHDVAEFLETLRGHPEMLPCFGKIVPVTTTFTFQSPEEFENQAAAAARAWVTQLTDKTFHVRMHRRGFQGKMSSQNEEHFLDHVLLEELARTGKTARITFEDPDFIIAVETVGNRAGLSLWSREDLRQNPFVKLD